MANDLPSGSELRQQIEQWISDFGGPAAATRLREHGEPLPQQIVRANREQLAAAGFRYSDATSSYGTKFVGIGDLIVEHGPDDAHTAICLKLNEFDASLWWVDGQPLLLPPGQPSELLLDSGARWLDETTLAVQVGGLWEHPKAEPRVHAVLGTLRGLLVHDVATGRSAVALPNDDETWRDPIAVKTRAGIEIHGERCSADSACARIIELP